MVVERILGLVALEGHLAFQLRVPALELEVLVDDLREQRRRLYRHSNLRRQGQVLGAGL